MREPADISPVELKILSYINDHHPITVREVADYYAQTNEYARTTVLTLMERLRQKGHLQRTPENGVYRYTPSVPKASLQRNLVRDFVRRSLGGSLSPFMAFLSEEARLTATEIQELKNLVGELDERPEEGQG